MVEAIANGIEDKLIDGLSFKMNPGASYVIDRRSVTFHPQGSNIYKTREGTKLIRILLTGDNWMDPSTLRILFQLNNDETNAAKPLRPLSGPWAFFRRMRILVAGQLVEDIDQYNRIHEMMQFFLLLVIAETTMPLKRSALCTTSTLQQQLHSSRALSKGRDCKYYLNHSVASLTRTR